MGNMNLKNQVVFKNFTFPQMEKSFSPKQIASSKQLEKQKNSIKTKQYLQSSLGPDKNFALYHFGSKLNLDRQYAVYQLPHSISILTYNIWFEEHNKNNRFQCILKMLELSNADFICLQEVTNKFVQLLHSLPKNGWIKDYYTGYIPMGWYDTVILSKYKCRFYKSPFKNSFMQRSMLFAELVVSNGENIIIGSMHYESLDGNQKLRQQQIIQVQQVTKECKRVIIAGDYNFTDAAEENKVIDKQYVDLWVKLKNIGQDRYTMPQTTKFPPWRPDHILCKLPKQLDFKQAQIHKIGQFSIPPFESDDILKIGLDNVVRSPSDHFGLFCRLPII